MELDVDGEHLLLWSRVLLAIRKATGVANEPCQFMGLLASQRCSRPIEQMRGPGCSLAWQLSASPQPSLHPHCSSMDAEPRESSGLKCEGSRLEGVILHEGLAHVCSTMLLFDFNIYLITILWTIGSFCLRALWTLSLAQLGKLVSLQCFILWIQSRCASASANAAFLMRSEARHSHRHPERSFFRECFWEQASVHCSLHFGAVTFNSLVQFLGMGNNLRPASLTADIALLLF